MNSTDIEKINEGYRGMSHDFKTMLPHNVGTLTQADNKLQIKSTIGIAEPNAASASTAGTKAFGLAGVPAGEMEETETDKSISYLQVLKIIDELESDAHSAASEQICNAILYVLGDLKRQLRQI